MGHHGPETNEQCEYLALSFSPSSAPLHSRWRNNGVSADFLGDYVTTFLPAGVEAAGVRGARGEIRHAVTYIANEFLENAMKYHDRDVDVPIGIRLELACDRITVSASNGVSAEQASLYMSFVARILENDARDLLLRQLEGSLAGAGSKSSPCGWSGLGLLTMIGDYNARLGWRFETHPTAAETMTVTTIALLPLTPLNGVSA
jgi:hypothetical protein